MPKNMAPGRIFYSSFLYLCPYAYNSPRPPDEKPDFRDPFFLILYP